MVAETIGTQPWRLPGCSTRCRELRVIRPGMLVRETLVLHDPEDHELQGRQLAGDRGAFDILETGLLSVDRRRMSAWVEERRLDLTPVETRMLLCLADHVDEVVPYVLLVREVWGFPYVATRSHSLVNAHLNRLRAKLGPDASGLVRTRIGLGLRLVAWPLGQVAPPGFYDPVRAGAS